MFPEVARNKVSKVLQGARTKGWLLNQQIMEFSTGYSSVPNENEDLNVLLVLY
jgi:hypothetical protein